MSNTEDLDFILQDDPDVEVPEGVSREQYLVEITDDRLFRFMMQFRSIAAEALYELLPEKVRDILDFSGLRIEPGEYCDAGLRKRIADCVFTVPLKEEARTEPDDVAEIRLILEHKSRLRKSDRAALIHQSMTYLCGECEHGMDELHAREKQSDGKDSDERELVHPLVIVVYTGEDVNLVDLKMKDVFRIARALEEYALNFPAFFVNLTRLVKIDERASKNVFLQIMYRIMTAHSPEDVLAIEGILEQFRPLDYSSKFAELDKKCLDLLLNAFKRRLKLYKIGDEREHVGRFLEPLIMKHEVYDMSLLEETLRSQAQKILLTNGALKSQRQFFREATDLVFGFCPSDLADSVDLITDEQTLRALVTFVFRQASSLDDIYERVAELQGK